MMIRSLFVFISLQDQLILGIMAWALVLPGGEIVARCLKHEDPLRYYLHAGIQIVGFLSALATVVLGQQLYAQISASIPAHRAIGIFFLTISVLQVSLLAK